MYRNSRHKLVCLDFDQTIIDSGLGFAASYKIMAEEFKRILAKQGISLGLDKILETLKTKDKEYNKIKFYDRDQWWNPMLEALNARPVLNDDAIRRLTGIYWDEVIKNTRPYPDTFEILDYLKEKYTLALISDTDGLKGMKKKRIRESNIAHYFDHVIIPGEDSIEVKPSPEPFLKIAQMANIEVSKENCVMVGDKPFTDIRGANAAGFTTILILRVDWEVSPVPDYLIKELSELKNIL